MKNPLLNYLSRYVEIDEQTADVLFKSAMIRTYPKGSYLMRQGEPVEFGFFVLQGCIRSYVLKNDEEKTLDFYIEEQPILPIGYGKGKKAENNLQSMEDSLVLVHTPELERRMMSEYPEIKEICLALSEVMAEKLQENLTRLQTTSAEERYIDLIEKRPDLLQRIPQYQIASFIGIKPESLSRIRNRIIHHSRTKKEFS